MCGGANMVNVVWCLLRSYVLDIATCWSSDSSGLCDNSHSIVSVVVGTFRKTNASGKGKCLASNPVLTKWESQVHACGLWVQIA